MSERFVIEIGRGGRIVYRYTVDRVLPLLWKATAVGGLGVPHTVYGWTEESAERRLKSSVYRMYQSRLEL